MNAFLNVTSQIQAYGDRSISSNPRLKFGDWKRDLSGFPVANPQSEGHSIDPGATKIIFDGTRTTTIGVGTTFAVSLSALDPSRYRITWTGGTNPTFRTDRALTLTGIAVTFAVLANNTVNLSVPSLAAFDFTGVVAGDTVFVPNVTTGDSSNVVSVLNSGFWLVLAVIDSKNLSLARFPGQDFEAVGETQTLLSNTQLQAYSTSGVQSGDHVDISAGFATVIQKTFEVATVTSKFVEIISTSPLPTQTGITPGAAGMIFYTDAKSFLYLEVDQEAALRLNGSSDNSQRLSPIEAGNGDRPGVYMKRGPAWSLSIVNRSTVTLNALVMHAE